MAKSILERIRKPKKHLRQWLVVIYALGGVGKTSLLGTLKGRGLVIDVRNEGGTEVLVDHTDHIDIAPVSTWEELNEIYQALRKSRTLGGVAYDWVAIDTITACQSVIRKKVIKEREEIASKAYVTRLQDWGSIGQLMTQLFERYRTLPMPVYFTAQERGRRVDPTDENSETIIIPDISPESLRGLIPHPILIGHLFMHENDSGKWERRLRVGPHTNFVTKARAIPSRALPAVIRRPNLSQIIAYMTGQDVKKPREAKEDTLDLTEEA